MPELKTNNPLALRLLMTDDLYLINDQAEQNHFNEGNQSLELLSFDYLGENNKFILILVNDTIQDIINQEDLITLTNILTAKQLELRDVAIVNLNKHPASDFKNLKQFFSCRKLILFGINPVQIGLQDITSSQSPVGNRVDLFMDTRILASYSFDEMRNDNAKKRLFWNAMKEI